MNTFRKIGILSAMSVTIFSACNRGGDSEPAPAVPSPVSQVKRIYVAAEGKIYKISNINNPVPDTVVLYEGDPVKVNVAWNPANNRIYCRDLANPHVIFSVNAENGQDYQSFAVSGENFALALDAPAGKIYWSENETIKRANPDGSNPENFQTIPNSILIEALTVDTLNHRIYWYDQNNERIGTIKTDGTDLKPALVSGVKTTSAITASPEEGKLYWSEQQLGIKSVGLNGGVPVTVYAHADAVAFSVYDPTGKEIYVGVGGNKIYRVGVSDGQVHKIYDYPSLNMYGFTLSY